MLVLVVLVVVAVGNVITTLKVAQSTIEMIPTRLGGKRRRRRRRERKTRTNLWSGRLDTGHNQGLVIEQETTRNGG